MIDDTSASPEIIAMLRKPGVGERLFLDQLGPARTRITQPYDDGVLQQNFPFVISLQQHQIPRQNATTDNSMNLGSQVTASGNPHMQVWSPSLKSEMWQERAPTMHGRKKEWGLISQLAKGRGKKTHPLQTWKFWRNRTHRQLSKICHSSPARSPAQTFPPTSLPSPSTSHSSSRSTTQTLTLTALPSPSACHSPAHSKSQTLPPTSLPPPLACPLTSSFHSPNITPYFSPLPLYVPPTSSSFHSTNPSAFFCSLHALVNKLKEDNKLLSAERDAAKAESEDMANALKAEKDKVAFLEKKMYELLEQILALIKVLDK
ncbi:hypothetical protein D8674_003159 [Pyrus ussuriensis x Pyrus communis]|uniref:Uncharacterized protein n=1 Tax=Pyrus ussuriensis x Pyrus communis TaxID=2448454 RepID=A0A5N5FV61_9ROSA|nr:hypothetical protein D8674_003159 [Pyrus ussuriensis x Pyrus communis]